MPSLPLRGEGRRLDFGARSPPLPLWYRPGGPLGLAPSSRGSDVWHRGSRPGVRPEASSGKEPPEGLCLQAFLLQGSPRQPHPGILQGERNTWMVALFLTLHKTGKTMES